MLQITVFCWVFFKINEGIYTNHKNLTIEEIRGRNMNGKNLHIIGNKDCSEVYFFGILNYSRGWNIIKQAEFSVKKLTIDKQSLNLLAPKDYSNRLYFFIFNLVSDVRDSYRVEEGLSEKLFELNDQIEKLNQIILDLKSSNESKDLKILHLQNLLNQKNN
jgi:hypothetical protein